MEVVFVLFVLFMIVEHPVVSVLVFAGLVLLACLPEVAGCSVTSSSCTSGYTGTGYLEKRHYADGTYSVSNLSGTGRTYTNGTLDGTSDSWIDSFGNEHRTINGRNEVVSPCWYNPSEREILDEGTGQKIGYEEDVLGVTYRRDI